jgi:hypothetical protein
MGLAACPDHDEESPPPQEATDAAGSWVDAGVHPDGGRDAGPVAVDGGPADEFLGTDRDATFERLVGEITGVQVASPESLARLGLTWDQSLATARRRFHAAHARTDVYHALLSLRNSLHDLHSRMDLPTPSSSRVGPPSSPAVYLPWRVRPEYADGAPTASYVVQATAPSAPGIAVGSRVVAVDGQPMDDVEREMREWFGGSSLDGLRAFVGRGLSRRGPEEMPTPAVGQAVVFDIVAPGETVPQPVTMRWSGQYWNPPGDDPCIATIDMGPAGDYIGRQPEFVGINYCVYPTGNPSKKVLRWFSLLYGFRDFSGGDPYLAYAPVALRDRLRVMSYTITDDDLPYLPGEHAPDGMLDPGALGVLEMDALGRWLASQAAGALLVDVRENGGGNFDPSWIAVFATSTFQQPRMQVYYGAGLRDQPDLLDVAEAGYQAVLAKEYLVSHPTADKSPVYPFICRTRACNESEVSVPPATTPLGVTLVLLTGPGCISACDTLASTMQDNGLATVAGLPSEAADSPVRVPLDVVLEDGRTVVTFVLTVAVSYHADGTTIQGHPPAPTCVVRPDAANRGRYLDAVVNTCL